MRYGDAASLLPGRELHPFRIGGGKGLFVVTVVNYLATDIGKYIEYSLAVAVTHGRRKALPLVPGLFQKSFGLGQYVVDLPVSSEVSVKGGKGIWGMPKHQASLDFEVTNSTVSSRYEKDGELGCHIEIQRPAEMSLPLKIGTANYCAFRGMLMKSCIYFEASGDFAFGRKAQATLRFGNAPGVRMLRGLDISPRPLFTAYLPEAHGVLDDYFENWFLTRDTPEEAATAESGDSLHSVVDLTRSEEWLEPPHRGAPDSPTGYGPADTTAVQP
jgi:hypothetical protein